MKLTKAGWFVWGFDTAIIFFWYILLFELKPISFWVYLMPCLFVLVGFILTFFFLEEEKSPIKKPLRRKA